MRGQKRFDRKILGKKVESSDSLMRRPASAGVCRFTENGVEHIVVRFSLPNGRMQRMDFAEFAHRPAVTESLAEAFYHWGADKASVTRLRKGDQFKVFLRFLDDIEKRDSLSAPVTSTKQLDTTLFDRYISWLDEPKIHTHGDKTGQKVPWTVKSRAIHFSILKCLVEWLKDNRRSTLPDDCEPRWAPWSFAEQRTKATETLTPAMVATIEAACLREIDETIQKFRFGQKLLLDPDHKIAAEDKPLAELLRQLVDWGVFERRGKPKLKRSMRALFGALHGFEGLGAYLWPTPRSLVPFVIYVASRTFFNPEAILAVDRASVMVDHPLFEERRTVLVHKGRGNRIHRRSFDTRRPHSVANVIKMVRELTDGMVPLAPAAIQNRLWLFRPGRGSKSAVGAFVNDSELLDTWYWSEALKAFRSDHSLPYFTLKQFRKTGSDRTHQASGGDIKASQILLGHAKADTTFTSYRSVNMQRRDSEKIARVQMRFVEWIRDGGGSVQKSDVLRDLPDLNPAQVAAIAKGENAVSSGFTCKNPLASPLPGQKIGKLCTAWLGCFACPNALIERSAEALACLLQVEAELVRARMTVDPVRFEFVYQPKLKILQEDILPLFNDPSIHVAASLQSANLLPLPAIE